MAVGSVIWGEIATHFGLRTTLLIAGIALLAAAAGTSRLKLAGPRDADTTPSPHWPDPQLVVERLPEHGPVLVTVEYFIDPTRGHEFALIMQGLRRIRRRDGAIRWSLFEDAGAPGRYLETFVVESWAEHLRQHSRATLADREVQAQAWAFHLGVAPPKMTHWIAARK
jgi:quinol monooxygenase YgiN